ncbi:MAG: redoxin domain-containing protein [Candidatus Zixiibacteriota bacterium]
MLWAFPGCSTKKSTPPEEFGSIFVKSTISDAKILLDNSDTGKQTPDTLFDIKAGSHLIEVEMDGYLSSPQSIVVEVEADKVVQASFTLLSLSYGSLSVSSNVQGANIALDNVTTDKQTPFLFDHNITVGTHIVSVFKDGYSNDAPAKEVVSISTADTVRLEFSLSPATMGQDVGNITPDFHLNDDFGESHELYAYRGFVCVINFWGLSCYYCMVELPYLEQLYTEYASDSFKILALNYEDDFDVISQKRNELDLNFVLLKDEGGAVKSDFGVVGTPVTIIIDRSGKIYYYVLGFPDEPDRIEKEMIKYREKLDELFGK